MHKFRRASLLTLSTVAMLAGSVMMSGSAQAASSPIAACGGGSYHEIDRHNLGSVATVHLLYNGTTNCVVTWRTNPGAAIHLMAGIAKENSAGNYTDYKYDDNNYSTYAGPVKVDAANKCIDWGGGAPVGGTYTVWFSGPSHCG